MPRKMARVTKAQIQELEIRATIEASNIDEVVTLIATRTLATTQVEEVKAVCTRTKDRYSSHNTLDQWSM